MTLDDLVLNVLKIFRRKHPFAFNDTAIRNCTVATTIGKEYPQLDDVKIPCSATGSCTYFTHSSTKHVEQKKHDERDGEVCPWWIDDSRIAAVGRLRDVRGVSGLSFQSVSCRKSIRWWRFDVETPDATLIYQSHADQQDQNGITKADAVDTLINDSHIFNTDLICMIEVLDY